MFFLLEYMKNPKNNFKNWKLREKESLIGFVYFFDMNCQKQNISLFFGDTSPNDDLAKYI
ncbi:hypothetical protein BpHYR1_012738 [Brachionus plicatilis]|uniref:Uncharacterized protein n=1 Tax=Brachionus plicatilis TaxID=10195 RepID=A0A3M7T1N8_BRAPC|nr:hypothetical protein BpHYR1_012738 [Brachionus plicatilis]